MSFAFRVRGPYATAIAKIILDSGNCLVDLSNQLAQRFSLPSKKSEVPHATIKVSDNDPNTLVIVGLRKAVEEIISIFISRVPYISYEYSIYGPYTTIVARVKGFKDNQCIAEYKDIILSVQNYKKCIEGETVIIHLVKPATSLDKIAIAFPGISILKDTLVLLDDGIGKTFFSEHIRDQERKNILSILSSHITRKGYSIRWRSSAKSAPLEKIAKDLEEALSDVERIRSMTYSVGDIVSEGESIAFIRLSRQSKEYLDDVRNTVIPTSLGHHFMRTCSRYNNIVELLDKLSKYLERNTLYKLMRYAITDISIGKMFRIIHRKPDGGSLEIGPIKIIGTVDNELGRIVIGKRMIKGGGLYDGLDIVKERGDIAITLIPIDSWFIIHRYINVNGNEKGMYININTPPEICPEDRTISYIDLYIDFVLSNGTLKLIDREEFDEAVKRKILSNDFVNSIEKIIDYIKNNIDQLIILARDFS